MKDVMGIINLVEPAELLKDLTNHRTLGAVPIGGRYRLIDFVLSNMVNAGLRNVGIFVQEQYRALMDHLGTGREWDLNRQRDGLFILPPDYRGEERNSGDIEILHRHYDYFERSRQDTVIMAGTSMVCNIDYQKALAYHDEKNADITVIYHKSRGPSNLSTIFSLNSDQKVTGIQVNPLHAKEDNVSMKMYIMSKQLLMELVDLCLCRGETDFVKDGLIKNLSQLNIYGYCFNGYVASINSLQAYYKHSMELLDPNIWEELFFRSGLIYTKVKNEAPAQYGHKAKVSNCLVANGCMIDGTVENSILFRGVRIQKGVHIKGSILMQRSEIKENAMLEGVILDKDVVITEGKHLLGDPGYPLVIGKKTVL